MAMNALTLLRRLTSRARLRHMQALIMLDDLRSMSRAARAMDMTQPAMTQLVAELESLLQTTLFLRHSRGVTPTPVAKDLLPVARRIIAAAEEAAERIAARQSRDGGMVRIAATVAGLGGLLHRVLPPFTVRHPNIKVMIETVIGQTLDASFAGEGFDLICCRQRDVVPEEWTFQPCLSDEMIIICGARHPLAQQAEVSHDELRRATWLQNHVATIARHKFDDFVAHEGWDTVREVQVVSREPLMIWSMLRSGTMLSLITRSAVKPWIDEGELVELPVRLNMPLSVIGYYWVTSQAGTATRQLAHALAYSERGDLSWTT